jgi:hypothetical protein
MLVRLAVGIAALGTFIAVPRAAEPVRDVESGLAVVPPDGYVAEILGPEYGLGVQISVRKREDGIGVTGCKVIFSPYRLWHEHNRLYRDGATQEEVNAQFTKPGGTADSLFDLLGNKSVGNMDGSRETFEHIQHGGAQGILHIRHSNPQVGGRVRWVAILDKPHGRVSVTCAALAESFDARRREFEAILDGTTLSR